MDQDRDLGNSAPIRRANERPTDASALILRISRAFSFTGNDLLARGLPAPVIVDALLTAAVDALLVVEGEDGAADRLSAIAAAIRAGGRAN